MPNFSMRDFVKRGLLDAVGKQPDYWIVQNAAGWSEKGVLELSDLEEIQNALQALDAKNAGGNGDAVAENNSDAVAESNSDAVAENNSDAVAESNSDAVAGLLGLVPSP